MAIDIVRISKMKNDKKSTVTFMPELVVKQSKDVIFKGGMFRAFWNEEETIWDTDYLNFVAAVDKEIDNAIKTYLEKNEDFSEENAIPMYLSHSNNGLINKFRAAYRSMPDSRIQLDRKVIFANTPRTKEMHCSRYLEYDLEDGDTPCYDRLMGTIYDDYERSKLEWMIGAVVTGNTRKVQKFVVMYGAPGKGKSTFVDILIKLFGPYASKINIADIVKDKSFALACIKHNPLIMYDDEADMRKVSTNGPLNGLVAHSNVTIEEKGINAYSMSCDGLIFLATNSPVQITDSKSGLLRRLIDVNPTGKLLNFDEYLYCMTEIGTTERGAICKRCADVYLSEPHLFDRYRSDSMLKKTNVIYNFFDDCYYDFANHSDPVSEAVLYKRYRKYCEDCGYQYPYTKKDFVTDALGYFEWYGEVPRSAVIHKPHKAFRYFKVEMFNPEISPGEKNEKFIPPFLKFADIPSKLDELLSDVPAQYAKDDGFPEKSWVNVSTTLKDLDTTQLHYVNVNQTHVVVDLDGRDENGNKSLERNIQLVIDHGFPSTYGEVSKSGGGIHLHYIFDGDPMELHRKPWPDIEVKVYNGDSSLRRKKTLCNDQPVQHISADILPKKEKKVVNFDHIKNEKAIRTLIGNCLQKKHHGATKPEVMFIADILQKAYDSGMHYDVRDMAELVGLFAAQSSNNATFCMKEVSKMPFHSADIREDIPFDENEEPITFFDIEIFKNLFLINWKYDGADSVVRMINPKAHEVEEFMQMKLVGFNNRRYDNHMIYAASMGYSIEELYLLSQKLIDKDSGFNGFPEAYNISYTDVYDFASAGNKKSLKKLEIDMGIHHQELGIPWDQPVPESKWEEVAAYCDNDVIATEAAFHFLKSDWTARQILADIAGATPNTSTNQLTQKIIFGTNKNPQDEFYYRDMSMPVTELDSEMEEFLTKACPIMMDSEHGAEVSKLPYFPGYTFEKGKSMYRGEEVGEGGYVYAERGIHTNVALLDVASMHPHSLIAECHFGPYYTDIFRQIVEGRVAIKHQDWESVEHMFDGKLVPYIEKVKNGEMKPKQLANALKTAINSVYGLTSAKFNNPCRDPRNIDNIVAKRGALFMINLKHEVQRRGFTVAHIKTDSIKIPNATPDIIKFVMDYGEMYGYTFEHEATYDRMCLVNNAVYIAKYKNADECQELYGYVPDENASHAGEWTATGAQFAVPCVFKTLFSGEDIEPKDMRETKSVTTAMYLNMNEGCADDDIYEYQYIGKVGLFSPIKPGHGGGELLREKDGKYDAVAGTKGYRWLEAEGYGDTFTDEDIDLSYYQELIDKAIEAVEEYGNFDAFRYAESMPFWAPDEVPFDLEPDYGWEWTTR